MGPVSKPFNVHNPVGCKRTHTTLKILGKQRYNDDDDFSIFNCKADLKIILYTNVNVF